MTDKTKIDLYREYVRVSDMCDAYNKEHSTDIKPWECVKCGGILEGFITHPTFKQETDRFKFAIAILEGRPVWVGDTVYRKNENWSMVVGISNLVKITDDYYTWTPPTKKRTFMLNGVELPCPVKNETDHCFQFGDSQFFYETEAECWKVTLCLENQFAAARDKE